MISYTSSPTQAHLDQVHAWLEEEERTTGHSFDCNWSVIAGSFMDGRLHCAIEDGEPIAFAVHDRWTILSRLEIVCIHPERRSKGIGRSFVTYLLASLSAFGTLVVELECAPPESERFWRAVGFEDVSTASQQAASVGRSPANVRLTKYLIDRLGMALGASPRCSVDLWETQFPAGPPSCTWELPRRGEETWSLSTPILYPCKSDWIVRIVDDGLTRYEGKVKYLFHDGRAAVDGYIYLKEFGLHDIGS